MMAPLLLVAAEIVEDRDDLEVGSGASKSLSLVVGFLMSDVLLQVHEAIG